MRDKPKENLRLLDFSSDQETSSDLQLEIIPRKKKTTRRDRNKQQIPNKEETNYSELNCILKWSIRGSVVVWLIVLTWLCITLYEQVSVIKTDVTKVSTSNEGVGDALQSCHTDAKTLRVNVTDMSQRISQLEREVVDLTSQLQSASNEIIAIRQLLSAAPSLADTPKRIAELQSTVAKLGAQISDYDTQAASTAHKQALAATTAIEELRHTIHDIELNTNDTIANITEFVKSIDKVELRVEAVNTDLSRRVGELQLKVDEAMQKPTAAPTTQQTPSSAAPVETTNAPIVSTTTTVKTTPAPPNKPSVLESN